MKVLWLINIPLPEASLLMNEKAIPFGSWLVNLSNLLAEKEDISFSIAFPKKKINNLLKIEGKKIKYYAFSNKIDIGNNKENSQLNEILDDTSPDIVNIFGTEYIHSFAMVNLCNQKNIKTVITIQGLASICSVHYMSGLPEKVKKSYTFRDLIKQDNLKQQQKKFEETGKFEIEAIKNVKHIIGRTTWDKACSMQINPDAKYHSCNEILREEFYKHTWNLKECEKYSIFISQGSYPIKGLHFMIEGMPLILNKYPKAKLYIGGRNIFESKNFKEKLKKTSYAKYIERSIKKLNLTDKVVFVGLLDEKQMCQRFLNTHVFVSSSLVENESNSLSEAKMLGVPSVASYVGGVTDRISYNNDGFFYQADAPYMLAYHVCKIFENDELAQKFSLNSRKHALEINDKEKNLSKLLGIYDEIYNE